jgi:hypothetical protein
MVVEWKPPQLAVAVGRLDRVDVYVDSRPRASVDVDDSFTLELNDVREQIRVEGHRGSNLKQVRLIRIT